MCFISPEIWDIIAAISICLVLHHAGYRLMQFMSLIMSVIKRNLEKRLQASSQTSQSLVMGIFMTGMQNWVWILIIHGVMNWSCFL